MDIKSWDDLAGYRESVDFNIKEGNPIEATRVLGIAIRDASPDVAERMVDELFKRFDGLDADKQLFLTLIRSHTRENVAALLSSRDRRVRIHAAASLGHSRSPREVPALLPLLDDKDPDVRTAAADAIRASIPFDRPAERIEIALPLLTSADIERNRLGLIIVTSDSMAREVDRVLPFLLHANEALREQATSTIIVLLMSSSEDTPAYGRLRDFYVKHRAELAPATMRALIWFKGDWIREFAEPIASLLDAADHTARWRAVITLSDLKVLSKAQARRLIGDPVASIARTALDALVAIEGKAAIRELAAALRHENSDLRAAAVTYLIELDARDQADAIVALADDDDKEVRRLVKQVANDWKLKIVKKRTPLDGWKKNGLTDLDALDRYLRTTPMASIADRIIEQARPSIRMLVKATADKALETGASKLGGAPDVPADFEWPELSGVALAFVAQINLAEVAHELLPSEGMLYFFVDANEYMEGGGTERIIYVPTAKALRRAKNVDAYGSRGITFRAELSLPSAYSAFARSLGALTDKYRAFLDAVGLDPEAASDRLFGHPNYIQSDCLDDQPNMLLLMQVDSDDKSKMHWGDDGRLMFLIDKAALARRDFDESGLEYQGY